MPFPEPTIWRTVDYIDGSCEDDQTAACGRPDEDLAFVARTEHWIASLDHFTSSEIKLAWLALAQRQPGIRNRLYNTYLPLVLAEAKSYVGHGPTCEELFDVGCEGLLTAIGRFDRRGSYKFDGCGQRLIRIFVRRVLAEQPRLSQMPEPVLQSLELVGLTRLRLSQELRREPTAQEYARALHTTIQRTSWYLRLGRQPLSLKSVIGDGEAIRLQNSGEEEKSPSPEKQAFDKYYQEQLEHALEKLPEREKKILIYREGLQGEYEHTLEEVGTMFQVTRERIRHIEDKAEHKLKEIIGKENGEWDEGIQSGHAPVVARKRFRKKLPSSEPLQPIQPLPHARLRHARRAQFTEQHERWMALRLLNKGDLACAEGDLVRAARCYSAAVSAAPMLGLAWDSMRWLSRQPGVSASSRKQMCTAESDRRQSLLWEARWGLREGRTDDAITVSRFLETLFPSWSPPRVILVYALSETHHFRLARSEYDELVHTPNYCIGSSSWGLLSAIVMGDEQSVNVVFHNWLVHRPQVMEDIWNSEVVITALEAKARTELLAGHLRGGLLCVKGVAMLREKPTQAQLLALYGLSRRLRLRSDVVLLANELKARKIYVPRRLESIGTIRSRLASHKRKVTDGPADGG